MNFFVVIIIAISLSMDAFSLSLAYGTINLSNKNIYKLSLVVGVYHFIMPLLGMLLGMRLIYTLPIRPTIIVFLILSVIGIEMIIDSFKEKQTKSIITFGQLLLFGLAVSIDSFSTGIGLKAISENIWFCAFSFSICSFLFTYFGLRLGQKLSQILGKIATIIGGVALITIGIVYLFS